MHAAPAVRLPKASGHPCPAPCSALAADIPGGRRAFHGERELYRSDHKDVIHSQTVLGRCCVHTLDKYRVRGGGWGAPLTRRAAERRRC